MTRERRPGSVVRTVVLVMATLATGLTAGVFVSWSNAIMLGLRVVDDRTFVTAARALDAAITNPLFIGAGFMGALLLIGLSAALHLHAEQRPVLMWAGAALVCWVLMIMITFVVHEPLNEQLRTAGEHVNADFAVARAQFDESTWAAWNTVRAVASAVAVGCLTWALVIHRQLDPMTRQ